jgi:UDP-3-O-[3-hydroxymyristoyl] glucosamine N-acyltransferase
MEFTTGAIAEFLQGVLEGDAKTLIVRPSKIEEGRQGSISFFNNEKYENYLYTTKASAILVDKNFVPKKPIASALIRVENVYSAVALLLDKFGETEKLAELPVISPKAEVHETAILGFHVSIGHFTILGHHSIIGDSSNIGSNVNIGNNVKIGNHCIIKSGVRILDNCIIGNHCIIHNNAIIGSDGFGFARQNDGTYKKVAQLGNVEIGNNVEIGANTTIDRATMGSTRIGDGVKLDNLIQIGHNVEIGENTVIAAQSGIAGSTKIGANCRIGGQVGISGHLEIADGTQIQAQSGVSSSVKESDKFLFGYPAIDYKDYIRSYAVFKKLPEIYKKLR